MQEGKQPLRARLQLLARLTLNAGNDTANQPARLAQLDDGNDRPILVQGNQGPAQIVRLGHRGTPSIDVSDEIAILAARPIASLPWREMDSNFQYASTARWHRATDLPLPPTVKRRSAGRPPPMARPRSEAQRGSVRPAAARSTHREMRCRRAGRPLSGREAPRHAVRPCEIRPGENLTLQYVSHDGRRPPAARAAATAPLPTAKSLPLRSADSIAGPGSILRPRRR